MQYFILTGIAIMMVASFLMGEQIGYHEGFKTALKSALRTNPPSEELEITCLSLWVNQQNKKHMENKK